MARPRSNEARQKMLDAATELALDVGVRAFTVNELARRSGVAKTTIYRHFPSTNELIITALDGLTPIPEIAETGTFHGDLAAFLEEIRPIFADKRLRALFLDVLAASVSDDELATLQRSMMTGRAKALLTIADRARARGELHGDVDNEELFIVVEGPLIVRSLGNADFDDLDLDDLAAKIIRRLNA